MFENKPRSTKTSTIKAPQRNNRKGESAAHYGRSFPRAKDEEQLVSGAEESHTKRTSQHAKREVLLPEGQ